MAILAPICGFIMIIWLFYNIRKDDIKRNETRKYLADNANKPLYHFHRFYLVVEATNAINNNNFATASNKLKLFFQSNDFKQNTTDLTPEIITILIQAYNLNAKCNKHYNRIEDAINDYSSILEIKPECHSTYNLRAICYSSINKSRAIRDYTKAINIEPNKGVYYYNRGLSNLSLGNILVDFRNDYYNKALEDGRKALSLGYTDAQTNIIDQIPASNNIVQNDLIQNLTPAQGSDIKQFINKFYLYNYIPTSRSQDFFSTQLLNFKNENSEAIKKWSILLALRIKETNIKFDYILRVLGSSEKDAINGKPLDTLCKYIAYNLKIEYIPNIISKNRTTQKLSSLNNHQERQNEIIGAFVCNNGYDKIKNKNVLIIDDVLTAGTTSNEVLKCMKDKYPHFFPYLFTLSKTNHDVNSNSSSSIDFFKNIKDFHYGFYDVPYSSFGHTNDFYRGTTWDDNLPF